VCLAHPVAERNTLCQLAFQCRRQFLGYSILLKRSCFVCNRPAAAKCVCECASFCSADCAQKGDAEHAPLCRLVRAGKAVTVDAEALQLLG